MLAFLHFACLLCCYLSSKRSNNLLDYTCVLSCLLSWSPGFVQFVCLLFSLLICYFLAFHLLQSCFLSPKHSCKMFPPFPALLVYTFLQFASLKGMHSGSLHQWLTRGGWIEWLVTPSVLKELKSLFIAKITIHPMHSINWVACFLSLSFPTGISLRLCGFILLHFKDHMQLSCILS